MYINESDRLLAERYMKIFKGDDSDLIITESNMNINENLNEDVFPHIEAKSNTLKNILERRQEGL